jgi:hypothetical protein
MGIRCVPEIAGGPADGLMQHFRIKPVFIAGKFAGSEKGRFCRSLFDNKGVIQIEYNGSDIHSLYHFPAARYSLMAAAAVLP